MPILSVLKRLLIVSPENFVFKIWLSLSFPFGAKYVYYMQFYSLTSAVTKTHGPSTFSTIQHLLGMIFLFPLFYAVKTEPWRCQDEIRFLQEQACERKGGSWLWLVSVPEQDHQYQGLKRKLIFPIDVRWIGKWKTLQTDCIRWVIDSFPDKL